MPSRAPSANEIAWAIVAACHETGDDPIKVATGIMTGGSGRPSVRARHYALHALLLVFPDLAREKASSFVGAPGKPMAFYHNSYNSVAKVVGAKGRRFANWWDETGFLRVVEAIRAAAPKPATAGGDMLDSSPAPAKEKAIAECPPRVCVPKRGIPEVERIFKTPQYERDAYKPASGGFLGSRDSSLREAVLNTQRMTPPPEE
jgi:hypothetical protein